MIGQQNIVWLVIFMRDLFSRFFTSREPFSKVKKPLSSTCKASKPHFNLGLSPTNREISKNLNFGLFCENHAPYGTNLLYCCLDSLVLGCGHEEDFCRLSQEGEHRDEDEGCDEERTDGVCYQPSKLLHQNRGDDDTDAAHCVGQNVQEYASHVCVVGVGVTVSVGVTMTTVRVGMVMAEGGNTDQVYQKSCNRHN